MIENTELEGREKMPSDWPVLNYGSAQRKLSFRLVSFLFEVRSGNLLDMDQEEYRLVILWNG
jgi:hypothetical protein